MVNELKRILLMAKSGKGNYERSEIVELKETIRKLKADASKKQKKIKVLKSEILTLQKAMNESTIYIDDRLADVPVEALVSFFSKENKKTKTLDNAKHAFEDHSTKLRDKWKCHKCDEGQLRMILINRHDGKHYFRSCNNENCLNRTDMKRYTSEVEG
jgi:hypothetical protein